VKGKGLQRKLGDGVSKWEAYRQKGSGANIENEYGEGKMGRQRKQGMT
jgi:hypothetical protein